MVLVERMLFQSPLGEQAEKQPAVLSEKTVQVLNTARQAYAKAVASLEENRDESAHDQLDSALTLYRQASALHRGVGKQNKKLARALPELRSRIAGYQDSLVMISTEKNISTAARVDPQKVMETLTAAATLEGNDDLQAAVQLLQALQTSLEVELVRIRNGETVVTRVALNNAEDNLNYEMQKYASNEKLLELLSARVSLGENKKQILSRYLRQSSESETRAMQFRIEGNLEAALKALESSTELQIKALKMFGINL